SNALNSQPGTTLRLTSSLGGTTSDADLYSPAGTTSLVGGTAAAPLMLEVMSRDLGSDPIGFSGNYAYGTLRLDGAYVKLVDAANNNGGSGSEALYVDTLIVPAGSTLDLTGLHVYARSTQINGILLNGSVSVLSSGQALNLSVPVAGDITQASQVDDWTVFGRQGQTLVLVLNTGASSSLMPLTPSLTYGEVLLVDPSGHVLATATNTQPGTDVT